MSRRKHATPSMFDPPTATVATAEPIDRSLPGVELDTARLGRKRVELLALLRHHPQTCVDLAARLGADYLPLVRDLRALGYVIRVDPLPMRSGEMRFEYRLIGDCTL